MRVSILLYPALLVASAATISARPILSGPVQQSPSPSLEEARDISTHLSHIPNSGTHDRHSGPYVHAYAMHHSADRDIAPGAWAKSFSMQHEEQIMLQILKPLQAAKRHTAQIVVDCLAPTMDRADCRLGGSDSVTGS
ncbi:uncharacterized protein B0H18DRAFT_1121855 [Fomitopsis serialis]|uniref:uncharacterized protein n=1 Tax=Fomitopsis serialis TaxID=139415 RepID=UPI00200740B8|nr:uncharacterized protein B0H18DRAFT_1121855 [Neoantrodia serialis]KAH9920620.1 hypothetical protein B0H18DRAFT_1121855 [Neoantrodia serialis]